jgi:hypothetical protein
MSAKEQAMRLAAGIFLVWGVATILLGAFNATAGNITSEQLGGALGGGAILLALAWWLDRPRKKQPSAAPPREGNSDRPDAPAERPRG